MKVFGFSFAFIFVNTFGLLSQEILSTSGNFSTHSLGSLSWTLGESMTETISMGTTYFTQGIQQPYMGNVGLTASALPEIITSYPNPFQSALTMENHGSEGVHLVVIQDNSGKVLVEEEFTFSSFSDKHDLALSSLAKGIYHLSVYRSMKPILICRIVKY